MGRTEVVGAGRLGEELPAAAAAGAARCGCSAAAHLHAVAAPAVHEAVAGHVEVGSVLAARHHVVLLRLLPASHGAPLSSRCKQASLIYPLLKHNF